MSESLLSALGRRVVVRHRLAGHPSGAGATDVVGHLLAAGGERAAILRADGTTVEVAMDDVVAAKVVGDAPTRPGWAVPWLAPDDMQRVCATGFPAREEAALGGWRLRAHDGITRRANSAMAVGDPGLSLAEALDEVREWYIARGLPPLAQLPMADPRNRELEQLGWSQGQVTLVQVAPLEPMLARTEARLHGRPTMTATVEDAPDDDWLGLMHDLDEERPLSHLEILTGPAVVGFAVVRDAEGPVGIGRASVEGEWTGITSVDVAPRARRAGIGSAVMQALGTWAGTRGARATYLQVHATNDAAMRLYADLGYVTHHPYNYRILRTS